MLGQLKGVNNFEKGRKTIARTIFTSQIFYIYIYIYMKIYETRNELYLNSRVDLFQTFVNKLKND